MAPARARSGGGGRHSRPVRLLSCARPLRRVPLCARRHQVHRSAQRARRRAAGVPCAVPGPDPILLHAKHLLRDRGTADAAGAGRNAGHAAQTIQRAKLMARRNRRDSSACPAGHTACGASVRAVSAACRPAVGAPVRYEREQRALRCHGARIDQRALPIRRGCIPRRLQRCSATALAALLARPGAVALRWHRLARGIQAAKRETDNASRPNHRIHGDAGATRQGMAVCAGVSRGPAAAPDQRRGRGSGESRRAADLRPTAFRAGARYAGGALHGTLGAARRLSRARRQSSRLPATPPLQSANDRVCPPASRRRRLQSCVHRGSAAPVSRRAFCLHPGAAAGRPESGSGRCVPVRYAPRLL